MLAAWSCSHARTNTKLMDASVIENAFRDWWEESYRRPPNPQAVMTHVAFTAHMLELIELLELLEVVDG